MEVKCPRCGKPALFKPENPYRPFCSERCKLIDLGQWADEKYAIPLQSTPENSFDDLSDEMPTDSAFSSDEDDEITPTSDSKDQFQ